MTLLSIWFDHWTPTKKKNEFLAPPLPEIPRLPSVHMFAECFISGTRQTIYLPSANEKIIGKQGCLPSAKGWALVKQPISEFFKSFRNSKQSLKIMRFGKMS